MFKNVGEKIQIFAEAFSYILICIICVICIIGIIVNIVDIVQISKRNAALKEMDSLMGEAIGLYFAAQDFSLDEATRAENQKKYNELLEKYNSKSAVVAKYDSVKNETIAENVIEIVIFIPIIALVSSVIVWVISLFMYGFGELVESNKLLAEKLKNNPEASAERKPIRRYRYKDFSRKRLPLRRS